MINKDNRSFYKNKMTSKFRCHFFNTFKNNEYINTFIHRNQYLYIKNNEYINIYTPNKRIYQ